MARPIIAARRRRRNRRCSRTSSLARSYFVYAADADDALQTHALHYPGEHIVSMQRGDGLS